MNILNPLEYYGTNDTKSNCGFLPVLPFFMSPRVMSERLKERGARESNRSVINAFYASLVHLLLNSEV